MGFDSDSSYEDEVCAKYRAQRLLEMRRESKSLLELSNESELIRKSKKDTMIVHFYKPEFIKCRIMNQKLEDACKHFLDIEFYKIEADACNIVTSKLEITTLPFLAFFKNGFFVDSLIGFEGLGESWFETEDLVSMIKSSNIYK